ncbi:DUF551 domain-containing protein [Burkholderia pseudomallei]|uniref:DUF551 domain-containing protein n=1 Tax=Burkholderia pseudomallei TaxID=28450 RepID=UPI000F0743CA|nr:DUF551 domain-containing protein [Burkholderia pseudomallei]VBS29052.1 putative bacteriophage protein [Burkholderia pseudomallei]
MSNLEKYRELLEAAEDAKAARKYAMSTGTREFAFFSALQHFAQLATELVLEVLDLLAEYEQRRKEDSRYMAALSTELQEAKRNVGQRCAAPDREAWISINDRLPDTGDLVLAANSKGAVSCAQFWHGQWIGMGYITHWMPLPTAPTTDKGGV